MARSRQPVVLQKENPAPMGVLEAGLSSMRLLEDKRPDHKFAFTAGSRSIDITVEAANRAAESLRRPEAHKRSPARVWWLDRGASSALGLGGKN